MLFSIFYFSYWACMKLAYFARPSALHRGYVLIWLYIFGWALTVAVTVLIDRFGIAAGYMVIVLQSSFFLALFIQLCEFFALPAKQQFAQQTHDFHLTREHLPGTPQGEELIAPSPGELGSAAAVSDDGEEPDENTPLRSGETGYDGHHATFASTFRRSVSKLRTKDPVAHHEPFEKEQSWSGRLPSWTWILQLLVLATVPVVVVGQIALFASTALHQTGSDGTNPLLPYLCMALCVVLVSLPLTPFLHRASHHLPLFLLVFFLGTLALSILRFPFSIDQQYKFSFQQVVDLDTGLSDVHLFGQKTYLDMITNVLPSAAAQELQCEYVPGRNIDKCRYNATQLVPEITPRGIGRPGLRDLVHVNGTVSGANNVTLDVDAVNTKVCVLYFDAPIAGFHVVGSAGRDHRFYDGPDGGVSMLSLFRREASGPWRVEIQMADEDAVYFQGAASDGDLKRSVVRTGMGARSWNGTEAVLGGRVECAWDDVSQRGLVPAFDEVVRYAPVWAVVTKAFTGLVVGRRGFAV